MARTARKLSLLLCAALVIPAVALAVSEGKYKGTVVDDSGKVSFKVDGDKVKKFEIDGVYADCEGGGQLISVFVPKAKIKGKTFEARYIPDPTADFQVTLKGKFKGQKASGTVLGEGVCGYEEEWTAKKG
jgi:hypothetical protein